MPGRLRLSPNLPEELARLLEARGLEPLWAKAKALPGGRGTARTLTVCGVEMVVKQEARGGLAGRLLPNLYLGSGPFDKEWALASRLCCAGLCARPVAQELVAVGPFLRVYQATEAVREAASLMQIWQAGELQEEHLFRAGRATGRLHRSGILHGDLNAGNILLPEGGKVRFLDLRHSAAFDGPPPLAGRRRNLSRLARSLHKVHHTRGLAWPSAPWERLASGYAEGWGEREGWLEEWMKEAAQGFRLRSLLWTRRGP
ncbi:MAG: lipopolysaccharide kinase InaA family protein [Acidobacteriota bacterium]